MWEDESMGKTLRVQNLHVSYFGEEVIQWVLTASQNGDKTEKLNKHFLCKTPV